MKCHDAKHHLDLFMDGELSVPENLKVLEHLNLCRACVSVYEGEKALRAALRAKLGSERAPEGLIERLARAQDSAAPAAVFPRRRWFSIAAAAGFFVVASSLIFTSPREMPQAFASELSAKHEETRKGFCGVRRDDCLCLCRRCCSDSEQPDKKFFHSKVGSDACSHDLRDLGYRPVGVSVWEHRGKPVCWTVLRDDAGHTISHGLVSTRIAMEAKPLYLNGLIHPVEMEPSCDAGTTCVFIFDTEAEAQRFRAARHR